MPEQQELRVSVSLSRKVQIGGYESFDLFMAVSGLEPGATDAEIEEALVTGSRAFELLKKRIGEKIAATKKELIANG